MKKDEKKCIAYTFLVSVLKWNNFFKFCCASSIMIMNFWKKTCESDWKKILDFICQTKKNIWKKTFEILQFKII